MGMNQYQSTNAGALQSLLNEKQVAAALGVTARHVRSLRARGLIPYIKLGRIVKFSPTGVSDALQRLTVAARN